MFPNNIPDPLQPASIGLRFALVIPARYQLTLQIPPVLPTSADCSNFLLILADGLLILTLGGWGAAYPRSRSPIGA